MKKTLAAVLVLTSLASAAAASQATAPFAARDSHEASVYGEGAKVYSATGTARVVSDITGRETTYPVSALITARSLDHARSMAKDALAARAAIHGRVVSVHVGDVY